VSIKTKSYRNEIIYNYMANPSLTLRERNVAFLLEPKWLWFWWNFVLTSRSLYSVVCFVYMQCMYLC